MATFEVWLADDAGNRLENLNQFTSLEYVIAPGQRGWFTLKLAYDADLLAMDDSKPDRQIHVFRAPDGGSLALEQVFFCRKWEFPSSGGQTQCVISGAGLNELLRRRKVAYYAASAQAQMTATEADDMMKRIIDDQLGSDSDTDYDGNAITTRNIEALGFSMQSEVTLGPSLTRGFAWRPLLAVLQDIQEQSRQAGSETFFDMVATGTGPLTLEFRTAITQPGNDRTSGQPNALRFGPQWGNVDNPVLTVDYSDVENFIYVGGADKESDRVIAEVSDTDSVALSQFGRIEGFVAHTSSDVTAVLEAAGNARLSERRVKTTLTAEIQDTPDAPYGGSGWKSGDKVTISYIGKQFDAIVRKVRVFISGTEEKVHGSVEI